MRIGDTSVSVFASSSSVVAVSQITTSCLYISLHIVFLYQKCCIRNIAVLNVSVCVCVGWCVCVFV